MPDQPSHPLSRRGRLPRITVGLLVALSGALLLAQDKPKAPKPDAKPSVELQVYVIRCTNSNRKIDAELKPLVEQLKPLRFTGYTIDRKVKERKAIDEPLTIESLGPHTARVTPVSRTDARVTIKFELLETDDKKKLVPKSSTTYSAESGKFALQMIPADNDKNDGGDRLLLAISGR